MSEAWQHITAYAIGLIVGGLGLPLVIYGIWLLCCSIKDYIKNYN